MIRRRYIVPEVVQTSASDCGPAVIKALIEGHGVPVRYDRIRDACATDVDGTSFDMLESLLERFGLDTDKALVPLEDLLLKGYEQLPAIVITRLPSGLAHFVVLWARYGNRILVMDPAHGRRWLRVEEVLSEVLVHTMPLDAQHWRAWVNSRHVFRGVMQTRLERLGVREPETLLKLAAPDASVRQIAVLDAALRSVDAMVCRGALAPGDQANQLVRRLFELATPVPLQDERYIPAMYWSAVPLHDDQTRVMLRGVPTLRIVSAERLEKLAREAAEAPSSDQSPTTLEPELRSIYGRTPHPAQVLWRLMPTRLRLVAKSMVPLAAIASGTELAAAFSMQQLLSSQPYLRADHQRLAAWLALLFIFVAVWAIDAIAAHLSLRVGRHIDLRFRVALLERLPCLPDAYFRTRAGTDLADRFHSIPLLRALPDVLFRWLRALTAFVAITAGLVWLAPSSALWVVSLTAAVLATPFLFQARLADYDLRAQTHAGALARFYLDALIGALPVRAHNAAEAAEMEQERLVRSWGRAQGRFGRLAITAELTLVGFGLLLVATLVLPLASGTVPSAAMLLVAYWALSLPVLANELALLWRRTATLRNEVLRLIEPLTVAMDSEAAEPALAERSAMAVSVKIEAVTVTSSKHHTILKDVSLSIAPGEHIAIVGASGAGKSSLVGLLLGWHRASQGRILVDGLPLTPERLTDLRVRTAWVDPAAQIWNRSLIENVRYGCMSDVGPELAEILDATDLATVLEQLEEGVHTALGEGGTLVSGGEGQRIRLARALYRWDASLVILDEPFRGLDHARRKRLLELARKRWRRATLLCVTHNVAETLQFDRVLVVDHARIIESGTPRELAEHGPRYQALLSREREIEEALWSGDGWRRVRLAGGRLES